MLWWLTVRPAVQPPALVSRPHWWVARTAEPPALLIYAHGYHNVHGYTLAIHSVHGYHSVHTYTLWIHSVHGYHSVHTYTLGIHSVHGYHSVHTYTLGIHSAHEYHSVHGYTLGIHSVHGYTLGYLYIRIHYNPSVYPCTHTVILVYIRVHCDIRAHCIPSVYPCTLWYPCTTLWYSCTVISTIVNAAISWIPLLYNQQYCDIYYRECRTIVNVATVAVLWYPLSWMPPYRECRYCSSTVISTIVNAALSWMPILYHQQYCTVISTIVNATISWMPSLYHQQYCTVISTIVNAVTVLSTVLWYPLSWMPPYRECRYCTINSTVISTIVNAAISWMPLLYYQQYCDIHYRESHTATWALWYTQGCYFSLYLNICTCIFCVRFVHICVWTFVDTNDVYIFACISRVHFVYILISVSYTSYRCNTYGASHGARSITKRQANGLTTPCQSFCCTLQIAAFNVCCVVLMWVLSYPRAPSIAHVESLRSASIYMRRSATAPLAIT